MEKIWVSQDWYIPVDEQGYVIGPCFEGMLGCVLQLEHGKNKSKAAMKIPRLLADTVEENAYICKMTEEEEAAVIDINAVGGSSAGLLAAQYFESNPLIRRRSTKNSFNKEARKQHDHVIFVSFERDKKPRFCSVNLTEEGFSVFPSYCKQDFEKSVSIADWERFILLMQELQLPDFSRTIYQPHDPEKRMEGGDLIKALNVQQTAITWYAAIPSIIFDWAQEDLQEAITKHEIQDWSLNKHFTLFEQVLRGVDFIHKQNMIHGDIRPANVMRIGSQEPEKYRLGDYGSYGREWQAIAAPESSSGLTRVGPAIGRQRETPFYSPERRAGFEFESANVAIIKRRDFDKPSQEDYLLLLGWRSELLSTDGEVRNETKEVMMSWQPSNNVPLHNSSLTQLQEGDRLRIRNFLFEIKQAGQINNGLKIYRCKGRYAQILHDRLIVYKEANVISDWTVVDLSNYVEFQQWSAATDLYGVGALCLYSLFSCGLQKQPQANPAADDRNPDTLFMEMIEILESIPYFKFFWEELEIFRQTIETHYGQVPQPSPREAAEIPVLRRDSADGQTLYDMALHATNNILQSTPKARIILEQFDFNFAHFLLFMHFVLACLHRESHMPSQDKGFMKPFAKDRTEPPKENGAASLALQRLIEIKSYLSQPFFNGFKCKEYSEVLDFNPRSDFQLRIELENLKNEILNLESTPLGGVFNFHPRLKRLVDKVKKKYGQEKEEATPQTVQQ